MRLCHRKASSLYKQHMAEVAKQVGVGVVSQRLYESADAYHAQIGPDVSRAALRKLQTSEYTVDV